MTCTFTPAPPHNTVGIGIPFNVASTFVGPLPTNTRWDVAVWQDSGFSNGVYAESFPTASVVNQQHVFGVLPIGSFGYSTYVLSSGDPCWVTVNLRAGFSTMDSGSALCTWSSVDGLAIKAWSDFNLLWNHIGSASDVAAILASVRAHYVNAP